MHIPYSSFDLIAFSDLLYMKYSCCILFLRNVTMGDRNRYILLDICFRLN